MNIRELDLEKEYDTLSKWWTERLLFPPPKIVLQAADGFAVQAEGKDMVIGWIYMTHKGVAGIVEWTTSNPNLAPTDPIKVAIEMLYSFFESYAKEHGCVILFSSTQLDGSLARLMKHHGWLKCQSEPHTHLIKQLS